MSRMPADGHVQRARDRRGGQRQHVELRPQLLQPLLLHDAEALLLVDDEQPEALEPDVLLQQPVSADDDVDLTRLRALRSSAPASSSSTKRDSISTVTGKLARRSRKTWKCCCASTVVGTSSATCLPLIAALNAARSASSVLPKPTSPHSRRSIGRSDSMSALISASALSWSGVSSYGKDDSSSCLPGGVGSEGDARPRLALRVDLEQVLGHVLHDLLARGCARASSRRCRGGAASAAARLRGTSGCGPGSRQARRAGRLRRTRARGTRGERRLSSISRMPSKRAMPWSTWTTSSPGANSSVNSRVSSSARARVEVPLRGEGRRTRPKSSASVSRWNPIAGCEHPAGRSWSARCRPASSSMSTSRSASFTVARTPSDSEELAQAIRLLGRNDQCRALRLFRDRGQGLLAADQRLGVSPADVQRTGVQLAGRNLDGRTGRIQLQARQLHRRQLEPSRKLGVLGLGRGQHRRVLGDGARVGQLPLRLEVEHHAPARAGGRTATACRSRDMRRRTRRLGTSRPTPAATGRRPTPRARQREAPGRRARCGSDARRALRAPARSSARDRCG